MTNKPSNDERGCPISVVGRTSRLLATFRNAPLSQHSFDYIRSARGSKLPMIRSCGRGIVEGKADLKSEWLKHPPGFCNTTFSIGRTPSAVRGCNFPHRELPGTQEASGYMHAGICRLWGLYKMSAAFAERIIFYLASMLTFNSFLFFAH